MENKNYHIKQTQLAGNVMLTINHIPTGNCASIIAGYGGAINAFVVDGRHILKSAVSEGDFEAITKNSFAGAQLFPFVNRVNNAQYKIDGEKYFLPVNDDAGFPHSLHGLIYNQPFAIAAINEAEGWIALSYHLKKDEKKYPFEFRLMTKYILNGDSFEVSTAITNLGESEAPMSYGWHPYIRINEKTDNCKLQLPATEYYLTDNRLIPDLATAQLQGFSELSTIGKLDLNQCFKMPAHTDEHITTIEDTDGTCIQLIQKGFGYAHYYIPKDRKSIAVEPQTGIPDALNNGVGLIKIQPGEVVCFSFKITVKKNIV